MPPGRGCRQRRCSSRGSAGSTVNGLEQLTGSLPNKIWQKITLLDRSRVA